VWLFKKRLFFQVPSTRTLLFFRPPNGPYRRGWPPPSFFLEPLDPVFFFFLKWRVLGATRELVVLSGAPTRTPFPPTKEYLVGGPSSTKKRRPLGLPSPLSPSGTYSSSASFLLGTRTEDFPKMLLALTPLRGIFSARLERQTLFLLRPFLSSQATPLRV